MRPPRFALYASVMLLLPACQNKLPSVAETPPPLQPPDLADNIALRPTYELNGRPVSAGTGFLVRDSSGRPVYLTAAHVMDESDWRHLSAVTLATMTGESVGTLQPVGLKHVGVPFDRAGAAADLVAWEAPVEKGTPLPLAAEDPRRNEWVWVAGQVAARRATGRLFRCKVTGTESGGITIDQSESFQLRAFSGAPVVNAKGQVVGMVLGGNEPVVLIARVSTIRQKLAAAGIQVP